MRVLFFTALYCQIKSWIEIDVPFDSVIIDLAVNLLLTEDSYESLPSCFWQVGRLKIEQWFQLPIEDSLSK